MSLYPEIIQYIQSLDTSFTTIPETRKAALDQLASYIRANDDANLIFICTHNSRRSHMSQLWAIAAAAYYGVSIQSFPGGTEVTAFNPRAIAAMQRAGFSIEPLAGPNPRYEVHYHDTAEPVICFSKKYDDPFNPTQNFAAVMTCSQADEACPIVYGSDARISIPYEDPKISDGTIRETEIYDERCHQIATEMLYVMSKV